MLDRPSEGVYNASEGGFFDRLIVSCIHLAVVRYFAIVFVDNHDYPWLLHLELFRQHPNQLQNIYPLI